NANMKDSVRRREPPSDLLDVPQRLKEFNSVGCLTLLLGVRLNLVFCVSSIREAFEEGSVMLIDYGCHSRFSQCVEVSCLVRMVCVGIKNDIVWRVIECDK